MAVLVQPAGLAKSGRRRLLLRRQKPCIAPSPSSNPQSCSTPESFLRAVVPVKLATDRATYIFSPRSCIWHRDAGLIDLDALPPPKGFACIHYTAPIFFRYRKSWRLRVPLIFVHRTPPFPVLKSSFIRSIALVMAFGSWRWSGRKYPAPTSFAIISLYPARIENEGTSLIS